MRRTFKEKIEPHLVPQENNVDASINKKFKKFAKELGLKISEDADSDETIEEIAKICSAAKTDLQKRTETPKVKQKRITENELDEYLENGWEIHTTLQSGDLVVKII